MTARRDAVAETKAGKKFNRVPAYDRVVDGKKIHVKSHDRSNPRTSTGKRT
jgi:hypothetical protein